MIRDYTGASAPPTTISISACIAYGVMAYSWTVSSTQEFSIGCTVSAGERSTDTVVRLYRREDEA